MKSNMKLSTTSSQISETLDLERKLRKLQESQKNTEAEDKILEEMYGKRSVREQKFFEKLEHFTKIDKDQLAQVESLLRRLERAPK